MEHMDLWPIKQISLEAGLADAFYDGAIIYTLAAGQVTPVNTTAGLQPAGINVGQITTTAAAELVEIATAGCWLINYTTPVQTDEGTILSCDASAVSDNPADLNTGITATGDTTFAFIVKLGTTGTGSWCDIGRKAIAVVS